MNPKGKPITHSFSYPSAKEPIVDELRVIAARERKSTSELIMQVIESYVKTHAAGNPSFEIDQWIEKPEFIGDPALRESNDKWDKYLETCNEKDLQVLMGTFQKRLQQTNNSWRKKKGFIR